MPSRQSANSYVSIRISFKYYQVLSPVGHPITAISRKKLYTAYTVQLYPDPREKYKFRARTYNDEVQRQKPSNNTYVKASWNVNKNS